MGFSFIKGYQKSQELDEAQFRQWCATAEILEQDAHGLKVLRLENGDILKIFRVKRLFSSARLYSYARRFCRNAARLASLGIPTVSIRQLYHIADTNNSAVLYAPLQGSTLRELARSGSVDKALLSRLGIFVAILHKKGIYFRSLHLGNIVLTPHGQFGLIDIADMSIFPWRLGCGRRLRNFRHMRRLHQDNALLGGPGWEEMLNSYLNHKSLPPECAQQLKSVS